MLMRDNDNIKVIDIFLSPYIISSRCVRQFAHAVFLVLNLIGDMSP